MGHLKPRGTKERHQVMLSSWISIVHCLVLLTLMTSPVFALFGYRHEYTRATTGDKPVFGGQMNKDLWPDYVFGPGEPPEAYFGAAVNESEPQTELIVNGQDTSIFFFPHQVALRTRSNGRYVQICGGSLVAPRKVVTAAHCISRGRQYFVSMGQTDLSNPFDINLQFITVSRVQVHERYEGNFAFDIAMLTLARPTILTLFVRPIRLATFTDGLPYTQCSVSGWGQTQSGSPTSMQSARFRTISTLQCAWEWFTITRNALNVDFSEICIKDRDSSPCFGDSGGPLTCNGRLAGIVSWGSGRCTPGIPGVFTR